MWKILPINDIGWAFVPMNLSAEFHRGHTLTLARYPKVCFSCPTLSPAKNRGPILKSINWGSLYFSRLNPNPKLGQYYKFVLGLSLRLKALCQRLVLYASTGWPFSVPVISFSLHKLMAAVKLMGSIKLYFAFKWS